MGSSYNKRSVREQNGADKPSKRRKYALVKLYDDLRDEEGYYDNQIVTPYVDNTNETALP